MRPKTRAVSVLAGVALAASALTACGGGGDSAHPPGSTTSNPGSTSTGSAESQSTIHWVSCKGSAGPSGYQCATLMVPRNPQNPKLGDIGMAIDRKPATGQKIGSLITNPGGPGGSGVDSLPDLISSMPSTLLARFDVVGFDPPGVGRTAPINCLNSTGLEAYYHADPAPTSTAGFNYLVSEDRTFDQGCETESGAELPYVGTIDAAMDMDLLRRALGDSKITYLGYSYGTYLGAVYARLYPTHIRAFVLDGAIDPANPIITQLDEQSASLDNQLQQFFTSCTSDASCPWKPGPNPTAAFEALVNKVRRSPLPAKGTSRTVGPSEVMYGTAVTLYDTSTWTYLEEALADAANGDGTDFLELFDDYVGRNSNGTYSNLFEANAAINCEDAPAPTIAQIEAAVPQAEAAAPIFGLQNLYSEIGCSVWPVPATGKVGPITAAGSPPIVVVGSTGDPITPYSWAQALAKQLQHGVLLTRMGDGHTGYRASTCIRNYVDNYLINLVVPPVGTSCPSN